MLSYKIVSEFNKRSLEGLDEVRRLYYPYVTTGVRKLTHDSPETEDLVAETFGKLIRHDGQFDTLSDIRGFLFKTVRNLCSNYKNRQQGNTSRYFAISQYYQDIHAEDRDRAESTAVFRTEIFRLVQDLPPRCKQIFTLFYSQGMTNKDIAEELNISIKAVEKQKTIVYKYLRMHINPKYRFILSMILI